MLCLSNFKIGIIIIQQCSKPVGFCTQLKTFQNGIQCSVPASLCWMYLVALCLVTVNKLLPHWLEKGLYLLGMHYSPPCRGKKWLRHNASNKYLRSQASADNKPDWVNSIEIALRHFPGQINTEAISEWFNTESRFSDNLILSLSLFKSSTMTKIRSVV